MRGISTYQTLARDLNAEPEQSTHALFETIHKHGLASRYEPISGARKHPPRSKADRRQVTILCCHLDFSPGADEPGPEQLAEPRSICTAVLRRYAGHITQGHDGYIYAYIGYPKASERAGGQAARAALEIQGCFGAPYRFRAGIHTGVIVTGLDPAPNNWPNPVPSEPRGWAPLPAIQPKATTATNPLT